MSRISGVPQRKADQPKLVEAPTEEQLIARQEQRRKSATLSWIAAAAATMAVITDLHSGLIHIGVGLSVIGSLTYAANLMMDEASNDRPPLLIRLIPGVLTIAAAVCLVIGFARR